MRHTALALTRSARLTLGRATVQLGRATTAAALLLGDDTPELLAHLAHLLHP